MQTWTPEAERLTPRGTPGTMAGGGAKAILHVTVSPSGGGNFDAMHRVLVGNKAEPHYLYDPVTDRLGQYFPLNVSARSLATGLGKVSCNKAGGVVIQVEVVAWPGTNDGAKRGGTTIKGGFTSAWKPGRNFAAMMRDIAAAGVTATFPMGSTAPTAKRATYDEYRNLAGWFGHCHVPGQDHWDPGTLDTNAFFAAAGVVPAASPAAPAGPYKGGARGPFPLPSGHWYGVNDRTDRSHSGVQARDKAGVVQIQREVGASPDGEFGPLTESAVKRWQKAHGLSADGRVGPLTWKKMTEVN